MLLRTLSFVLIILILISAPADAQQATASLESHNTLESFSTVLSIKDDFEITTTQKSQGSKPSPEDLKNELSYAHALKRVEDLEKLYQEGYFEVILPKAKETAKWLDSATTSHFTLFKAYSKDIEDTRVSQIERQLSLDFAKLRDRAILNLGKLYMKLGYKKKAVTEFVKVVKSDPDAEVSTEAYKLLIEIGFSKAAPKPLKFDLLYQ